MKAGWIGAFVTLLVIGANTASADEALARRSGCLECHGVEVKETGPAFHDIAAKYRGDGRARAALVATVHNGGKGNWTEITGGVPMPPYSARLSDDDIERLVDWVLSR